MANALIASLRSSAPRKDDDNVLTFQHEGYLVFVGRNAFSNERLIAEHKEKHGECFWMHATAARGSHIILCVNGLTEPSDQVLQYAAVLALRNSHSEARTVSVSLLKDVYKPEDGGMGVWKSSKRASVEVP